MNKSLPIIIVVLLLLLAGGAFLAFKNKPVQTDAVNTAVDQGQPNQDSNVFTSIKDALSKSLSLECTYQDEKGTETKTYIKSGAVRAESKIVVNGSATESQVIFKDRKMYSWDNTTKKGVVFEIPEETENPQITPSGQRSADDNKSESFLAEIEKYKDACKPAVVSDSLFTPPSDVEFQDFSSILKNFPTGTSGNGSPPSFDLEQLKKQYAPENE